MLNSLTVWSVLSAIAPAVRGGFHELRVQYVETLPIPNATAEQKAELAALAETAQGAAQERYRLQQQVRRRIPDLAADSSSAKLTNKLKEWWTLPDFVAFQEEVKKVLKADIPLKERNDWESWISETRAEIDRLTDRIRTCEREINARAYALFGLDAEEIALLEKNT